MPRSITALAGKEVDGVQIPVSLLRIEIPGTEIRYHDLDVPLYLNPSTGAVSMAPGAGLLEFLPGPDLTVPQIDTSDDAALSAVTVTLSNAANAVNGTTDWWAVQAANLYRGALASVWQGNLALAVGAPPFAASFVGVVALWSGELSHIAPTIQRAVLTLEPPDAWNMPIPRRRYSSTGFPRMKVPGSKIKWGTTEKTV